jgi:Mor family transcriptional regulator
MPLWGISFLKPSMLEEFSFTPVPLNIVAAAIQHLLKVLYKGRAIPNTPPTRKQVAKMFRNLQIKKLYAEGVSVPELAEMFNISRQRIHQILRGKNR